MKDWFTINKIDDTTYIISEYRHWEETHCYLLIGSDHCLLIDTGLGICNIYEQVCKLTDKPITAKTSAEKRYKRDRSLLCLNRRMRKYLSCPG